MKRKEDTDDKGNGVYGRHSNVRAAAFFKTSQCGS
jgi:hypothetical protein